MDILSLRLFLRIADLGSVTAAARDLSLSPASASARLVKLEDTVGFRLFNRTTRAVSLTTDGAEFVPYARQALETLQTGLDGISGRRMDAQGLLRVTMPASFGRMHVIPVLRAFKDRYPLVSLDLRLSDDVLDVVEGAYDLVIRNAPLRDSALVARKLASDHRVLAASPDYLARYGAPKKPADLTGHRCVVLSEFDTWRFESGESIAVGNSTRVNDGEAMRALIETGHGIGVQSLWLIGEQLARGQLEPVLTDYPLQNDSAIWALYPSNRIVPPKVRAMIDFLLERFHPTPPWITAAPDSGHTTQR